LDLQLLLQSVPITINVVSWNPAHGEVYSIQHYVIQFVSDLAFPSTPVFSTNKSDRHDITEILLKVALNTINLTLIPNYFSTKDLLSTPNTELLHNYPKHRACTYPNNLPAAVELYISHSWRGPV
jgi:hypothetical protein